MRRLSGARETGEFSSFAKTKPPFAFASLLRATQGVLARRFASNLALGLTLKIVGAGEQAEDLLQEIFLKLWLKRESLPSVENPKAWIARITCYACYNWLRHEKYCEKANAQIKYLLPNYNNEVEEAIGFTETADNLAKAVKGLPPQTRMIFKLNKEQGMKISEIANYLQLSPQTVKNTLGTALKKVKAYLRQQGLTS